MNGAWWEVTSLIEYVLIVTALVAVSIGGFSAWIVARRDRKPRGLVWKEEWRRK